MPQFIQTGNSLDYTPAADVAAGAVIQLGDNFFGVAPRAIAAGALGAVSVSGVYAFPKGAGAIAAGAVVYWDADNQVITATAAANAYIGRAIAAASGSTVHVLLNGSNLGAMTTPTPQTAPTPTAADVTPTSIGDVTVTGTYADDDDGIAAGINANRADVATLATNLNKLNDDLAAVVAALKTSGVFK
ncbi:MAG: DUF2190 family protein [Lentisphaerae bacterium]|jgi:predicted RecA/RadA family phage recombinase|nr:DUF2190 family protein [Lentisphaerota bacterium]